MKITYNDNKADIEILKEKVFGFAIGKKQINTTLTEWIIIVPFLIVTISSTSNISNINIL